MSERNPPILECKLHNVMFGSESELTEHLATFHHRTYCNLCQRNFSHRRALILHNTLHHWQTQVSDSNNGYNVFYPFVHTETYVRLETQVQKPFRHKTRWARTNLSVHCHILTRTTDHETGLPLSRHWFHRWGPFCLSCEAWMCPDAVYAVHLCSQGKGWEAMPKIIRHANSSRDPLQGETRPIRVLRMSTSL